MQLKNINIFCHVFCLEEVIQREIADMITWLDSVLLVGIEYVAEVRDGLKGDPLFLM